MRLRSLRKLEEMEIRKEHKALTREAQGHRSAARSDERLRWDAHRRASSRRSAKKFGAGPLGRAPHRDRRRAGGDRGLDRGAWSSARRSPLSCRRRAGSARCKGSVADPAELKFKEGDRLKLLLPCRDHRPAVPVRHQRARLHAERRRAAARTRRRPAGAPAGRARNEDDVVALFVPREGRKLPGRLRRAAAASWSPARTAGGEAHRQAGAQPAPRRGGGALRPGRGRPCRGDRQHAQAAGVPARTGAGDGARRRRDPAALQATAAWPTRRCSACAEAELAAGREDARPETDLRPTGSGERGAGRAAAAATGSRVRPVRLSPLGRLTARPAHQDRLSRLRPGIEKRHRRIVHAVSRVAVLLGRARPRFDRPDRARAAPRRKPKIRLGVLTDFRAPIATTPARIRSPARGRRSRNSTRRRTASTSS